MKRFPVIFALMLACACSAVAQDPVPRMEEYLAAVTKQGRFSGAVLVARDGKPILSKGYGLADREWEVPNTPQTKFRLGSITKQFTAALVLRLQEQGKLGVQDPLCKYFADCPPAWSEITIHHLLTHTSGVPNFTSFPDYQKTMMQPATMDSLIGRFKDRALDFKPGEKFSYSNSGYVLLGYVIEKVGGKSYEDLVREQIFAPLGMAGSGYDRSGQILPRRAAGYSRRGEAVTNAAYLDMSIPHAAGALYSTVEDLLLWDQALFTEKVLSAKSRELMFAPFKGNYAYGWAVQTQLNRKQIAHGGGINGFATMIARYPEDRATVIVLSNYDFASAGRIARDLAAILFGEKYEVPRERVVAKVDPKIYDAYVGQYEVAPDFVLTVTREGDRLMAQRTGQDKSEWYPESETRFFLKVVDAQVTFVKDEQGRVTHLVLHEGGDRTAKKIK